SVLNRLIPVLIRSTPESPGPPWPNTSTPTRSLGSDAFLRASARPKVGPPGFRQSTGSCRVAHCEPATTAGSSLPSGLQSAQCSGGLVAEAVVVSPAPATPSTTAPARARRMNVMPTILRAIACWRHRGRAPDDPDHGLGALLGSVVMST